VCREIMPERAGDRNLNLFAKKGAGNLKTIKEGAGASVAKSERGTKKAGRRQKGLGSKRCKNLRQNTKKKKTTPLPHRKGEKLVL